MQKDGSVVRQNLGVDVAKDTLEVVLSTIDSGQYVKVKASRSFANTLAGFKHLQEWLEAKKAADVEVTILLEATGIYHEQLAWFLHQQGYQVSVILPSKAKKYLQATGNKSKNDKMDAKGLARMGLEQRLPLWQPLSENLYQLRLLTRQLEDFNTQRTAFLNQLHALSHSAFPTTFRELPGSGNHLSTHPAWPQTGINRNRNGPASRVVNRSPVKWLKD